MVGQRQRTHLVGRILPLQPFGLVGEATTVHTACAYDAGELKACTASLVKVVEVHIADSETIPIGQHNARLGTLESLLLVQSASKQPPSSAMCQPLALTSKQALRRDSHKYMIQLECRSCG